MYWITTSINTIMLKLIIIHNRNRERKQKTKCGTRYHFHKSSSCGHDYITFLFCFFLFSDFMLFLSIFFVFVILTSHTSHVTSEHHSTNSLYVCSAFWKKQKHKPQKHLSSLLYFWIVKMFHSDLFVCRLRCFVFFWECFVFFPVTITFLLSFAMIRQLFFFIAKHMARENKQHMVCISYLFFYFSAQRIW